jgi:hypothetical protein
MVNTILNYLGQQSTWKGLLGLGTAVGISLNPEQAAAITAAGIALISVINVFRNEKKQA